MMNQAISDLLAYAKIHLGLKETDEVYLSNRIIEKLRLDSFEPCPVDEKAIAALRCPDSVTAPLVAYAKENGVLEEGEEEFFTSDLLDMLSPRPSEVLETFEREYVKDPEKAFDGCMNSASKTITSNWSAISKNKFWVAETTKNKIEITINLSKPEKNNKLTGEIEKRIRRLSQMYAL